MAYTKEQIHDIVLEQRKYFRTGETLDINWRKQQLRKLKEAVLANKEMLQDALHQDLGRSPVLECNCNLV